MVSPILEISTTCPSRSVARLAMFRPRCCVLSVCASCPAAKSPSEAQEDPERNAGESACLARNRATANVGACATEPVAVLVASNTLELEVIGIER